MADCGVGPRVMPGLRRVGLSPTDGGEGARGEAGKRRNGEWCHLSPAPLPFS